MHHRAGTLRTTGDVIRCIDLDGLEKYLVTYTPIGRTGIAKITISTVANIKTETIENMKISFTDGSENDQSKDVLRIQNYFTIQGSTGQKVQHNDVALSRGEQFILNNGVEDVENKSKFKITVTEPYKNNTAKEREVGASIEFDPVNFMEGEAVGFAGGKNFKAGAFNTYEAQIEALFKNIKKTAKTEKLSSVTIDISHDDKLDKHVRDTYTELLRKKYGADVKVNWAQTKRDKKISTRSKGKYDTNVSITAIK